MEDDVWMSSYKARVYYPVYDSVRTPQSYSPPFFLNIQLRTQLIWSFLDHVDLNRMNQNKTKKEENKKTLWSQSNKTYVRNSHSGLYFLSHTASWMVRLDRETLSVRKWFLTRISFSRTEYLPGKELIRFHGQHFCN